MSRSFNANTDLVNCGSASSLDAVNVFTWAAWIYPTANAQTRQIIGKNASGGKRLRNNAGTNNGELRLDVSMSSVDAVARSVGNILSVNQWHFVAATFDDAFNPRLYRAPLGGVVAEVSYLSAPVQGAGSPANDGAGDFQIGGDGANFFPGSVAEVFVIPAVLNSDQLTSLAYGIMPRECRLYLPLYGFASPEPDYSGNRNNGAVTGAIASAHPPVRNRFAGLVGMGQDRTVSGGSVSVSAVPRRRLNMGALVHF